MRLINLGTVKLREENKFYTILLDDEIKKLYKLIDYHSSHNSSRRRYGKSSIIIEELDESVSNYIGDLFDFLLQYHIKKRFEVYRPWLC
ncbi:MAG: hypothetical protein QXJ20_02470 [Candidatus Aenigmatarchaeota archaeon]